MLGSEINEKDSYIEVASLLQESRKGQTLKLKKL